MMELLKKNKKHTRTQIYESAIFLNKINQRPFYY